MHAVTPSRLNIEGYSIVLEVAVKLFVRSSSASSDVETAREMSLHAYCNPETATGASEIYSAKFKGRVLPEEHRIALQNVVEYAQARGEKLEVFDVSSMADWIRALGRGVVTTPTLIAYGTSFKGLTGISRMVKETE